MYIKKETQTWEGGNCLPNVRAEVEIYEDKQYKDKPLFMVKIFKGSTLFFEAEYFDEVKAMTKMADMFNSLIAYGGEYEIV